MLRGGSGADRLSGRSAQDLLFGMGRGDRLLGGSGNDRLAGGAGDDRLNALDGRVDVVDCGTGDGTAIVDRRDTVRGCERVQR